MPQAADLCQGRAEFSNVCFEGRDPRARGEPGGLALHEDIIGPTREKVRPGK
jgi:hypothetical protein